MNSRKIVLSLLAAACLLGIKTISAEAGGFFTVTVTFQAEIQVSNSFSGSGDSIIIDEAEPELINEPGSEPEVQPETETEPADEVNDDEND